MLRHKIILLWTLLGIGMLSVIAFHESFEMVDYQGEQSKIRITVSYANDTSNTHAILVNSYQKYTISQEYSWTNNNFTRFNLQGYSIDNNPIVPIQRSSYGNFTLDTPTDSNHSIVFLAKPQFKIITPGTNKINFFPSSQTNDNWFDADSDIQIIAPYVLQSNQEDARRQLNGWSLDSPDINIIPRQESGTFKSHTIHMSSMHKIDLEYTTQYYIKVISNFGQALGTGWYDSGTISYVSVVPIDDILVKHVFTGWQGQVIGSENQESVGVLVDSPKIIVANWVTDYTNVSTIGIVIIAIGVLVLIYRKRRTSSKA
ncbi:MAG: hypothetical protein D4R90_05525 [Nitrosopumilales archaeon]|nr:MAG: hypothetical protein D4R90_05525 [Nitrosopumilales archaeon]